MDVYDFFQKLYFFEIQRKDEITKSMAFPVTILIILIGAISYLLRNFDFYLNIYSSLFFGGLTLLTSIAILWCIYFIYKALTGKPYEYLPYMKELKKYHDSLKDYHSKNERVDDDFRRKFEEDIIQIYATATTENSKSNDSRSSYRYQAYRTLAIITTLLILASVPYLVNFHLFQ